MDMLPTPEQRQIEDSIGAFLAERFSGGSPLQAAPVDARDWSELAGLGVFAIGLPEELGGAGLGLAEEVLVAREIGRHLVSPRALATGFAARLAARAGQGELAAELASGARAAAFAVRDPSVSTGAMLVVDHAEGDLMISLEGQRMSLFEPGADGGAVEPLDWGLAMRLAEPGRAVADISDNDGALALGFGLQIAAALAGISEAARDDAVKHAREREQFGQLIGAFQAVKHKCADMAVRSAVAWSQTVFAALAVQSGRPDAALNAASARWLAQKAALTNASENIQVHGGMGFTHEHIAHRFLKRAHTLAEIGGTRRRDLEAVIAAPRAT